MRYGGIGEIEVFKYCKSKGLHAKFLESFDAKYDLLVESKKVDVKTRCGKVPLSPSFFLNVQAEHASADKDVIIFCYLNESNGDIQVLGGLTLSEFLHEAKLKRLGDTEPNGFAYHCDTFVIHPSQLKPLEEVIPRYSYDDTDDRIEDAKLGIGYAGVRA